MQRLPRSPATTLLVSASAAAMFATTRRAAVAKTAQAKVEIRAALLASGNGWAMVEMIGRRAHLRGTAPSESGRENAVEVAKRALCRVWFGTRSCAESVTSDFGAAHVAWPELRASVDRNILTLTGHVPDRAMLGALMDRTRGPLGKGDIWRVVDRVSLLGRSAPPGVDVAAGRVAAIASLCDEGGATFHAGVLSVDCQVSRELEGPLRELIDSPLPAGYLGDVRVTTTGDTSASASAP